MNYELEFMPISTDETYKFDYDRRHGVALELSRNRTRKSEFSTKKQVHVQQHFFFDIKIRR